MFNVNITEYEDFDAIISKFEWFFVLYDLSETKISINFIFGYESKPTQDDLTMDMLSVIDSPDMLTFIQTLKANVMNKKEILQFISNIN